MKNTARIHRSTTGNMATGSLPHTTHKVQVYTHKLTLGGGASIPSNTISTHTVCLRDLSHGFYIVNTNIINNTLNLDLHLSLLGYSYVHFDL